MLESVIVGFITWKLRVFPTNGAKQRDVPENRKLQLLLGIYFYLDRSI
jgi:hypothetical protein